MATRSATRTGWFTGGEMFQIAEPRWMRSVWPARYARNVSDAERCEYSSRKWCSETHTYLKPDASASFASATSFMNETCS